MPDFGVTFETAEWLAGFAAESLVLKEMQLEGLKIDVADAVNVAKRNAPVGSGLEDVPGELRDDIGIKEVTQDHIDWGTTLPYAPEVEFGNTKDRAQPFMRPAMAKLAG